MTGQTREALKEQSQCFCSALMPLSGTRKNERKFPNGGAYHGNRVPAIWRACLGIPDGTSAGDVCVCPISAGLG